MSRWCSPSVPWIEMASRATPMPTSWSRALSAAPDVSYIAVNVRSVIDGVPFLGDGDERHGLAPLNVRLLGSEPDGLADELACGCAW